MSELGPSYDGCPVHCTRPERDQKRGCPDCSVTILYQQLKEETELEFNNYAVSKGHKLPYTWKWSMSKLMSDVGGIGSIDARMNGKGYDPTWNIRTRALVVMLRNERSTLRRSKELERKKEK